MQIFLIGHRGVGKTSLLQRLQIYGMGTLPVFDLDREIERKTGKTVTQIFQERGEEAFRALEEETLQVLTSQHPKMVCALGAGFPLHRHIFPASAEIVWVRRASDARGRIFLDRPRLDAAKGPLEEYQGRFGDRESLYGAHCDWVYWVPEGLVAPDEIEKKIWGARLEDTGGILTLRPDHFRNPRVFRMRIAQLAADFYELRDDLLSSGELEMALAVLPTAKILISFRRPQTSPDWKRASDAAAETDWALELGDHGPVETGCVSLHDSHGAPASEALARLAEFESRGKQLKWSPLVETFGELETGLRWQAENPANRSFLPRSSEGRWSWARLYLKDRQKFNFFRDGDGSSKDQPTLHEWARALSRPSQFGAVLGSPVEHSYSPVEHASYAKLRQMSFFAIDIREGEWDQAWPVLMKMGLRIAAVTSPLKKKAFLASGVKSETAAALESVNTLSVSVSGEIRGHNTDLEGFREMVESSNEVGKSVVWGGGGTRAVIRSVLPGAIEYSARTGKAREADAPVVEDPDTLIWAASPEAELPPTAWRPKQVLDLNYRDDSRAKEFARETGARYISGLVMFHAQASAQREEWEKNG